MSCETQIHHKCPLSIIPRSSALCNNRMASSGCTSRKIFACEIVAYNDAELDQYLEEHCVDGGVVDVDVQDPENLPPSFIERLRDRAEHASSPDQSRPVDADQLTSRVLGISSGRNSSPRPLPQYSDCYSSDAKTPPRIPYEVLERENYNKLVKEGGRPLCTIDLLDEVIKNPLSQWDLLRPWVQYPPDLNPDPEEEDGGEWDAFRSSWRTGEGSATGRDTFEKTISGLTLSTPTYEVKDVPFPTITRRSGSSSRSMTSPGPCSCTKTRHSKTS
ncbi:hypothetical protein F5883DRAFT_263302 [Diaporthe sp. PMI_573]|nr:hypothetical protein F5883DRAFT_263302 [Diaporthaceae sp. PMI_573]